MEGWTDRQIHFWIFSKSAMVTAIAGLEPQRLLLICTTFEGLIKHNVTSLKECCTLLSVSFPTFPIYISSRLQFPGPFSVNTPWRSSQLVRKYIYKLSKDMKAPTVYWGDYLGFSKTLSAKSTQFSLVKTSFVDKMQDARWKTLAMKINRIIWLERAKRQD